MKRIRDFYKNATIYSKFAVTIPLLTIVFWIISSLIGIGHITTRVKKDFTEYNTKIVRNLAVQTAGDIRYADFTQVRRIIRDFYDPNYMEYLAVYSTENQPVAVYPMQFRTADLTYMEQKISDNAGETSVSSFFHDKKGLRYHFQNRIADERGKVIGYIAMGGDTNWLTKIVRAQFFYFAIIGLIVLGLEIIIIIYLTKVFTKPFKTISETLRIAQQKEPSELISTILAQSPINSCIEANAVDSVLRKLLITIQRYQEDAKQLAIQASIGNIVNHIAHDLRNPLSTVLRFISRAKDDLPMDREWTEYSERAKKCADKINQMADDLLDYKKAREIKKSVCNLQTQIKEALFGIEPDLNERNIQMVVSCSPSIRATLDVKKFHRMIANIVINGEQAISHDHGIIEVNAISKNGKDVLISISDNGCGISQENLPKIFDSSFSFGKPNGTGLGLSYCKNVIEAHGGSIDIESALNIGTKFTITFPDAITNLPESADDHLFPVQSIPSVGRRPWLLIEDNFMFRQDWRTIFTRCSLPKPIEVTNPYYLFRLDVDWSGFEGAIVDYDFDDCDLTGAQAIEFLKKKGVKKIYLCSGCHTCDRTMDEMKDLGVPVIPKPLPENIEEMFRSIH